MPAMMLVLMFTGIIALPAALYTNLAHPAWSWLYLIDPADISELLAVLLAVVQAGAVLGAWWLGAWLCEVERRNLLLGLIAALGLAACALIVLLPDRIGAYGSYEAHTAGATVGLMNAPLGYALIALVLGKGAAAGFVAVELARASRRARLR